MTNVEIANEVGCSAAYIGQISNGKRGEPVYSLGRNLVLLHAERT